MKTNSVIFGLIAMGVISLTSIAADTPAEHPMVASGDDVVWGPAPPALPPGAQMAVLAGDPAAPGTVIVRVKMPAGYTVPPHWHPTDEHVTVLSGSLTLGMGDKIDEASAKTLTAGGYAVAPMRMHHFAMSKDGAIIQISLMGPFGITYVNPADDPRSKAPPKP